MYIHIHLYMDRQLVIWWMWMVFQAELASPSDQGHPIPKWKRRTPAIPAKSLGFLLWVISASPPFGAQSFPDIFRRGMQLQIFVPWKIMYQGWRTKRYTVSKIGCDCSTM